MVERVLSLRASRALAAKACNAGRVKAFMTGSVYCGSLRASRFSL